MKIRKLKKFKQEQQGWPDITVQKSRFGYSDFYNMSHVLARALERGELEDIKFVHPKFTITSWSKQAWRNLNCTKA